MHIMISLAKSSSCLVRSAEVCSLREFYIQLNPRVGTRRPNPRGSNSLYESSLEVLCPSVYCPASSLFCPRKTSCPPCDSDGRGGCRGKQGQISPRGKVWSQDSRWKMALRSFGVLGCPSPKLCQTGQRCRGQGVLSRSRASSSVPLVHQA